MTGGGYLSMLLALTAVLAFLGVALSFARRLQSGGRAGAAMPMAVLQRLPLGAKQGLAAVRIADRVVILAVAEGGAHMVLELAKPEASAVLAQARPVEKAPATEDLPLDAFMESLRTKREPAAVQRTSSFVQALRLAVRKSGVAFGLVVLLLVSAHRAEAQSTEATALRNVELLPLPTVVAPAAPVLAAPPALLPTAPPVLPPTIATTRPSPAQVPSLRPRAPTPASAPSASSPTAPAFDLKLGGDEKGGGLHLSGAVGTVIAMGLLTLLPTLVLMMTSFTRILIVLQFLRQAIGTQTAPPAQLIGAFALLLTGFVMAPTLEKANRSAIKPWLAGKIEQKEMFERGVQPFREFMLRQTREHDLEVFVAMSAAPEVKRPEDASLPVLMAAFVTSELRTAFQIGFVLFLPFIVIDIVVAAVLMSMGMFMLPPAMISLPFKLLLFVLVDGWTLVVQSLVASFH